ncbi:hypothetical protein TNCV_1642371 [Trichonephila clavipes]|nr:hypothetical protein TNCV_1642371 [Trichonephila clavipes]
MAVMNRAATSRAIPQKIQSVTHHSVFVPSIRCRLQQSGMPARHLLFRLPLTGNHRRLSHQWCDERWTWTTELCLLRNPASACNITMIGFEFGDTMVRGF